MIGVIDILVLLSVTVGPTKAATLYVTMATGAEPALKRAIAIRSVLIATIICVIFVLLGRAILRMLHISIPALLIAGWRGRRPWRPPWWPFRTGSPVAVLGYTPAVPVGYILLTTWGNVVVGIMAG